MVTEKCLEKYSDEFYSLMYGRKGTGIDASNIDQGRLFLQKYYMDDVEYEGKCMQAMRKVFANNPESFFDIRYKTIQDLLSNQSHYFSYQSSPLFWKESYELIQAICVKYGDRYIYILEEERCETAPEAAFKLKIPVNHSWEMLANGGCIANVLFNMFQNNYYVFGDSGKWGKWCDYDNDFIDYEVFAYKYETPQIAAYKDYFAITEEDYKSLNMVPPNLRGGLWNIIRRERESQKD
jgi:hypothetical protein